MKIHIVKQGDSLYSISQKYGVPLQTVIEANPQISNPNVLAIGEKVKIPKAPVSVPDNSEVYYKHTVKQGDTLWKLSKAWGVSLKDMVEANPQLKNPNALMTGEVVNIPKKGSNASAVKPEYTASNVSEKTQVGGKEYTGPKEEPAAEVIPAPKPEPKSPPKIAPESNSAPHPTLNTSPIATSNPAPNLAPNPVPNPAPNLAPNIQMENAPVQEMTPVEMQSLFVQITVPNQELVTQQEAPKNEVKPLEYKEKKEESCDNVGYPGLGGNPYYCPPNYSYASSPNMNMNAAPSYAQPFAYGLESISPYSYPGNMYPEQWYPNSAPNMSPEQWNPNAAPNISPEQWNPNAAPNISPEQWNPNAAPNISPEQWNPNAQFNFTEANVSQMNASPYSQPQYDGQSANLPWPSCGCGAVHVQPTQTYLYDMPMYNTYPAYGSPNAFSAYGAGMPNQGLIPTSPVGAFGGAETANIPANPQYPGLSNYSQHNRVPEIQAPEAFVQETPEPARIVNDQKNNDSLKGKGKGSAAKETIVKAKTSSQTDHKKNKSGAKSQRSSSPRSTESGKRRRNPWISN